MSITDANFEAVLARLALTDFDLEDETSLGRFVLEHRVVILAALQQARWFRFVEPIFEWNIQNQAAVRASRIAHHIATGVPAREAIELAIQEEQQSI